MSRERAVRSWRRFRKSSRGPLLAALLAFSGGASAQLLAEVVTVAAASAQLDPGIRLPSGSFRVLGQVPPALVAKLEGAAGYGNWEAYTARGLATRLFPAHMHQLSNSFALAGYFQQSRSEQQVGDEKHVKQVYAGSDGNTILLYVIETPTELVWLIGRSG